MRDYLRGMSKEEFAKAMKDCVDKMEGLNDKDWEEIISDYDMDISRDCLRKSFTAPLGGYAIYRYMNELNSSDDEKLKEIEDKRLELEKERKKIQAVKIELNRNLRSEGRQELLYENIRATQERLPLPKFREYSVAELDGEYILSWADIHYGATFESENNIYSREIAKERFEYLTNKVKDMCILKGIRRLTVCGLGDDIQGLIRMTDLKVNDIPVVESVVEVSRLIATTLNELSSVCDVKYYHTMNSNHTQTRGIGSKANELIKEDLEFIIGNYIKDLLFDNERVEVVLSNKDYQTFELEGQNFIMLHGHQIKGIKNVIKNYSLLHRKFYDVALVGHYHGGQSISVGEGYGNTEVKCVPSFVGSDPYSDSLSIGSKAMAKLYKVARKCGIVEEYTIILN